MRLKLKNIWYKCFIMKIMWFWGQIWKNLKPYNFKTNKDRDVQFVAF